MSRLEKALSAAHAFRREHQILDELQTRIHCCFERLHHAPSNDRSAGQLLDSLASLRDHLGMLFALEGSADLAEDWPDASLACCDESRRLLAEHTELFNELCRTVDMSEDALCQQQLATLLDRIEQQFNRFCTHFRAHETRENQLLLDSVSTDIGVGD